MVKKVLIVSSFCVLVSGNLIVSGFLFDSGSYTALSNLENIAYAQGEGGGSEFVCYSGTQFIWSYGSRVLWCSSGNQCCYIEDKAPSENDFNWCGPVGADCD